MTEQEFLDNVYFGLAFFPMSLYDRMEFAGCTSDNPLISIFNHDNKSWTAIVDGTDIHYFVNDDECSDNETIQASDVRAVLMKQAKNTVSR